MARETVMSTPIFDQLLREMAKRAEQPAADREPGQAEEPGPQPAPRRRHRAD